MKRSLQYSICILALVVFATACSKYLDETPKGSVTPVSFFKTANDLQMAEAALAIQLNGAFNTIVSPYYGGDDIISKRSGNKIEFSDFDVFNANSSNSRMTSW